MNPHNRSHFCVLLAFIGATITVTWPLVLHLTNGIPYGGDAFQFIWNGWWFSKASSDPNLSIWWTPYQYAPTGASLLLHDLSPFNAFIQTKLTPLIGDIGAYNLLILFHYVLGAWGAYILAWYFTGNRSASVVAGIIYGFSAHHAMHLSQLSTVSSGWLPLSIYYLVKYTRDGGRRDGVMSILILLAAAMSHWYHFVFAWLIFFGLMLIGQVGLIEHLKGKQKWFRAIVPWLIAIAALSPIILDAWREAAASGIQSRIALGAMYRIDPIWMILPPPDHPFLGWISTSYSGSIPGNITEGVASLGLVAIALGFLAWFRRNSTTRIWCWMGLILFLLALGPTLTVLGLDTPIPGPFKSWSMIPGLNLVRIPARFVGPFTLALGFAAAGWIAGLNHNWRTGMRRLILLWVVPILIIFETLVIPIPLAGREYHHPALESLPEIYTEITGDPTPPDLIVNFPIFTQKQVYLYHQTIHEIPTYDGNLSNPPSGARERFLYFNWEPESVKDRVIDLILYHPWALSSSLGECFFIPDHAPESHATEEAIDRLALWAGQDVEPLVFFKDVMGYRVGYEDEMLIVFIP